MHLPMQEKLQLCYICHIRSQPGLKTLFPQVRGISPPMLYPVAARRGQFELRPRLASNRTSVRRRQPQHCALCLKARRPRSRNRLRSTNLGIKPIEGPSFSDNCPMIQPNDQLPGPDPISRPWPLALQQPGTEFK